MEQPPANTETKIYYPIKDDLERKIQLVVTNPRLALRIFDIFGDEDIGKMFVARYACDP